MKKTFIFSLFLALFSGCAFAHEATIDCGPHYEYVSDYHVVKKPYKVYYSYPYVSNVSVVYTHGHYHGGGHYYKKGNTVFHSPYKKVVHKKKYHKKKKFFKKKHHKHGHYRYHH